MPKMFKAVIVAAMLSSLTVIQTNLSVAQVTGVAQLPIKECSISTNHSGILYFQGTKEDLRCQGFWLPISSLKTVLEPQGIRYEHRPTSTPNIANHVFIFPNNNELVIHPGAKASNPYDADGTVLDFADNSDSDFVPGGNFYEGLSKMTIPTSVEGWDNPKIQIASTSFTLGTTEQPVTGDSAYSQIFNQNTMSKYFPPRGNNENFLINTPNQQFENRTKFDQYLKIKNATPNSVYLMLYRVKSQGTTLFDSNNKPLEFNYQAVDISPVFKTGYLIYRNPAHELEFIDNPKDLEVVDYGGKGKVVLMRFDGKLNTNAKSLEVVPADQIEIVKHPGR